MYRHISTLLAALAMTVAAFATDYTDKLRVTAGDETLSSTTGSATLDVKDAQKHTYTLRIKNVTFKKLGQTIGIGTIVVDNLKGELMPDGATRLSASTLKIEKGDDADIQWIGAMSFLPVVAQTEGLLTDDNFYAVCTLNLVVLQCKVTFGDGGFQLPNADFEDFHETNSIVVKTTEPNRWHTLASAQGIMAPTTLLASQRSFQSGDTRPGSAGKQSAVLISSDVIGLGANSVLTTGRVKAGSAFATSNANHQYLDLSDEDKDGNGDPFYAKLNACPDSIAFWVKFKQGPLSKKNAQYATAMMHAVITDGTLYQDPEKGSGTPENVVAKAIDNGIESNGQWTRICLPFDYASYAGNGAKARAVLVTFSTNAQPGVASNDKNQRDSLWVDDVTLVYNARVKAISVKGQPVDGFAEGTDSYTLTRSGELGPDDIEVTAEGQGALVTKTLTRTLRGMKATVTVMSADYQASHTYTLNVNGATPTGIGSVYAAGNGNAPLYNLDGTPATRLHKGTVYVKEGRKQLQR